MALSEKLNILFPMSVDESSIVVNPAPVTTLPASDLFSARKDKLMRVMGNAATIKLNANKLDVVSGIGLGFHNLAEGSTITIRWFDGLNQTGNVVKDSTALSSGTIKPWGEWVPGVDNTAAEWQLDDIFAQVFFYAFDQIAWLSCQIDIVAPNNTQIDLGRLMLGYVFEPVWNYQWGLKFEWIDEGSDRIRGDQYRQFSFKLDYLSDFENDRYEYEKMKATKQRDLLICLNPSATGLERLKNTAIMKRTNNISRTRNYADSNSHKDTFKEVTQ